MKEDLRHAWGEWLNAFHWDAWCTLTFREERSHASATRAFERFGRWLRREGNPAAGWFYAHEVGSYGRLHLHALVGGLEPYTSRRALWRWWFDHYGRAQILPFDPGRGAAYYVSKYVTKGELSHYDIEPPSTSDPGLLTLTTATLTSGNHNHE